MITVYRKIKDGVDCIVWTNMELDYEEYRKEFGPHYPDIIIYRPADISEMEAFDNEREMLDIPLENRIISIMEYEDFGVKKLQYTIFPANIRCCPYDDFELAMYFIDRHGDFKCVEEYRSHKYTTIFRELKYPFKDERIQKMLLKIKKGSITWRELDSNTKKLGNYIAKAHDLDKRWDIDDTNSNK